MRIMVAAASTAALAAAFASPAAAQSAYGDTQLSFQNGVVYDDDLVPGRAPNASFLLEEQSPQVAGDRWSGSSSGTRAVPANSPDLIGPDGRARRNLVR